MTGIIILAAGTSIRLGKPKQNLVYKDQTLLQRNITIALATNCRPVIVVLGGNQDVIKPTIESLPVDIVFNPGCQEGMSSSIRAGIHHLEKNHPKTTSVILMLCDQPFVDKKLLNKLVLEGKPGTIIASGYNNTVGPPAFFDGHYFQQLLRLKGGEGAKHLMLNHLNQVITVPFEMGSVDIDTMEDFERLKGLE